MHSLPLIHDLAVILATAGIVTLVFQKIKQPVVLGYIIAGLIVGPHTPPYSFVKDVPNINTLAELGVIFLTFTLGLEFSFRKLARVGVSAGFTSFFEVAGMLFLGFVTGKIFGWSTLDSIFLGAMLSISSTTIIIKALDELGLKSRRFAETIFAILIVEDLVAILMMVALSTLATGSAFSGVALATSAGKLVLIVGSWFLAGYFLIPRFIRFVASFKSDEMLTILSLALCLVLVVIASLFNYSTALGAFIMGSILAESTESRRIEDLMRPLRDLFAAIFFVSIGMLMNPMVVWHHGGAIFAISLVTIFGKIVTTTLGALITGQTLRSSLLVGFSLAQIGEFSFIIATLGLSTGQMSPFLYPVVVAVSLLTTFTTPYLIRFAPKAADLVEKALPTGVKIFLNQYHTWWNQQGFQRGRDPEFYHRCLRWFLNGFVVTLIIVAMATYGLSNLQQLLGDVGLAFVVSWLVGIALSSFFIWGMITSFRGYRRSEKIFPKGYRGVSGAVALFQIFTVIWLGILSLAFFPARYVGLVTLLIVLPLFTRLYRRLEVSYRWLEETFTSVFKPQVKSKKPMDIYRELAPWDEHLVRLKVHSDSPISGRTLKDFELRKRYGLNVVAIQRGSRAIVAPKPEQQVFPKDELLVLGTDFQIDSGRNLVEKAALESSQSISIEAYEMKRLFVGKKSALIGRTIRGSGIREDYDAMVVGVERSGQRIMNPQSEVVLAEDDVLWLVGESEKLDRLLSDFGT